jgi:hypothetical protein
LGVRLATSPCKKKFVEILRNPRRGQGSFLGCGATDDDDDNEEEEEEAQKEVKIHTSLESGTSGKPALDELSFVLV